MNDSPTVYPIFIEVVSGDTTEATLTGSDVEGSNLTYSLASSPGHGQASVNGNILTYIADKYVGDDSFTVVASDGTDQSSEEIVSVSITVVPISFADLEPLDNVTTTMDGDKIVITLASNSCMNLWPLL